MQISMIHKQMVITLLFCLLFCSNVSAQNNDSKYIPEDKMFSYSIPSGWVLREMPGRKYKVAVTQPVNGFAPNINIVDEVSSSDLNSYVDGNLQILTQLHEKFRHNFKILSRSVFTTMYAQSGVRVITESDQGASSIRQTFFFFDGKDGRKLIVTCTVLAIGGEKYDPVFEKSLKTFQSSTARPTIAWSRLRISSR